jgi:hypothetical protein
MKRTNCGRSKAQSNGLSRRQLLQLGAASVGALGLPLLVPERAIADNRGPQRLVIVFTPNGTVPDAFWPITGGSETEFALNTIMQPLAAYRERLLVVKGLNIAVAQTGPGGPHQKGVGGLLTNAELQTGSFTDGDGKMAGWANGISVDQELAQRIGQNSYLPSLELGVRAAGNEVRSRISYSGPGAPMPPINAPEVAYDRLFSSFLQKDPAVVARRQSVLAAVKQQYDVLTPTLSRTDQTKLEQHQDLMRGIERRLGIDTGGECASPQAPGQMAVDDENTMPAITAAHLDLITAAFACDLTRIVTLQFSSAINEIRYPWLPSLGSGHMLSHSTDAAAQAEIVLRETWTASQIANLMSQLATVPEGNGTMLDNTLIVWANELGWGSSHTHNDIPFLLAGGAPGVRFGRYMQLGATGHGALLASLLNVMGVAAEGFGDPKYALAPLNLG